MPKQTEQSMSNVTEFEPGRQCKNSSRQVAVHGGHQRRPSARGGIPKGGHRQTPTGPERVRSLREILARRGRGFKWDGSSLQVDHPRSEPHARRPQTRRSRPRRGSRRRCSSVPGSRRVDHDFSARLIRLGSPAQRKDASRLSSTQTPIFRSRPHRTTDRSTSPTRPCGRRSRPSRSASAASLRRRNAPPSSNGTAAHAFPRGTAEAQCHLTLRKRQDEAQPAYFLAPWAAR